MKTIIIAALLALSTAASAAELTTYRCSYERFSDGEKIRKVETPFAFIFIVDPATSKGTVVGGTGSGEVRVIGQGSEGVSFIEITASGNVMTTAVDSKRTSIHSRQTIIAGQVVPSQYYGSCVVGL